MVILTLSKGRNTKLILLYYKLIYTFNFIR
ncbi:MAG: hypothetical protein AEth_01772 [Candidatus Argoarchaeum ethanivorans]|uniref:Uncharacterized protein n=1 Tax=Candidatus Argoarchaeum ethanivorans TaxID=2608793 RepID=A0A8B3S1C1_9EURY|nr:MAG: hypothetical protein AEth_01772 [Candidatus Argoarchaeum ethanivorans]